MRREIEKALWRYKALMWIAAFITAVMSIVILMRLFGELPESPPNKLNILREGVKIRQ